MVEKEEFLHSFPRLGDRFSFLDPWHATIARGRHAGEEKSNESRFNCVCMCVCLHVYVWLAVAFFFFGRSSVRPSIRPPDSEPTSKSITEVNESNIDRKLQLEPLLWHELGDVTTQCMLGVGEEGRELVHTHIRQALKTVCSLWTYILVVQYYVFLAVLLHFFPFFHRAMK